MSQPLDSFRSSFPAIAATDRQFSRYISEDDVKTVVLAIVESGYGGLGKVCYVRGLGGQPRSVYSQMERLPGVLVVKVESPLPPGLRFIPSHGGLVKIEDPSRLIAVFDELTAQSSAVIYVFDSSLEGVFINAVRHARLQDDETFGVNKDSGYLIYLVDEDRDDSPTGMADFLSYDKSGPWREIIGGEGNRAP